MHSKATGRKGFVPILPARNDPSTEQSTSDQANSGKESSQLPLKRPRKAAGGRFACDACRARKTAVCPIFSFSMCLCCICPLFVTLQLLCMLLVNLMGGMDGQLESFLHTESNIWIPKTRVTGPELSPAGALPKYPAIHIYIHIYIHTYIHTTTNTYMRDKYRRALPKPMKRENTLGK